MKFLVIEDNNSLNDSIKTMLRPLGECESAYDGEDGLFMAQTESYDLILLDLMLPKLGGLELLNRLRQKSVCPLIILTALDSQEKKVEGLRLGADDYITKPFERDELVARVEAVLRRYNNNFHDKYVFKNMELDFHNKMFMIDGNYIKLSGKIYDVLEYFVRNRNIIIPKEQLFNRIWGFDCDTIMTVTEVYISNLRKILESNGCGGYLRTIKNVGYMWCDKDEN
ncbi:MAG: response regulator transcription factor [Clostridia bacterium]